MLRASGSLRFDPRGFGDARCVFTLAHHKASELRLCHAHGIAPMLHQPIAQIWGCQRTCDGLRQFVHYSGRSAPQWTLRYRAINATLLQMFNKKLQQGWDQIRAADAMSDETMRRNTQFLDSIGRQEVAMRSNGESSGGSGGGGDGFLRDEGHDRFSDLMRSADIF
jgi:hypothetical protein